MAWSLGFLGVQLRQSSRSPPQQGLSRPLVLQNTLKPQSPRSPPKPPKPPKPYNPFCSSFSTRAAWAWRSDKRPWPAGPLDPSHTGRITYAHTHIHIHRDIIYIERDICICILSVLIPIKEYMNISIPISIYLYMYIYIYIPKP